VVQVMMMRKGYWLLWAMILQSVMPIANATGNLTLDIIQQCTRYQGADITGIAISHGTGKPLYCEYHYSSPDNIITTVEYWDDKQQLIVKKKLDFSTGLASPSVDQQDFRHGERRQVSKQSDDWLLRYQPANREGVTTPVVDKVLRTKKPIVVDAGFDKIVRQQWDVLVSGKAKVFRFASPIHGRTISLRVKRRQQERCLSRQYDQQKQICYVIQPQSTLLRWFAKPLALVYDKATRRLLMFSGVVNITSDEGGDLSAAVYYQYRDDIL